MHIAPDCPATIKYAWAYAFTQGEVDGLTPDALGAVNLPSSPACPGSGGSTPSPVPISQHVSSAKLQRVRVGANGTVTVLVNVTDAGSVSGVETAVVPRSARKKRTRKLVVSRARKAAAKAGQVKLVLKLNQKGKRIFRSMHKLPVTLSVTCKPATGTGNKLTRHLTLKQKKRR